MNNNTITYQDLLNESSISSDIINVTNLVAGSITDNSLTPNMLVATDGASQLISQTLLGTTNRVTVSTVGATTTLSGPQDIATTSSVQFSDAKLSSMIWNNPNTNGWLVDWNSGSKLLGVNAVTSNNTVNTVMSRDSNGDFISRRAQLEGGQLKLFTDTFPFKSTTITSTNNPIVAQTITIPNCGSVGTSFVLSDATASSRTINDGVNFTGTLNVSPLTASQAVVTDGSKNLASLAYSASATANTLALRDGSGNVIGANIIAVSANAIGSSPNANGMTVTSNAITLQPADANYGGILTNGTQTIAGEKQLTSVLSVRSITYPVLNIDNSASGTVGIDFQKGGVTKWSTYWDSTNGYQLVDPVAGTIPIKILPSSAGIVLQQNDITLAPTALTTSTKPISVTDTTDSSSGITGSIRTLGGCGITKGLWVGQAGTITGQLAANATTESTSSTTGSVVVAGGIGLTKQLYTNSNIKVVGANYIEFQAGNTSKETNAGKIAFNAFNDSLNIVGGSVADTNRRIMMWAEQGCTLNGFLTTTTGIVYPNGGSTMTWYQETTQSLTWIGAFNVNQAFTMTCTRVGRQVTIMIPDKQAVIGSGATISLLANQSANYRPAFDVYFTVRIYDNGAWATGLIGVFNGGNIIVYTSPAGGVFSGVGGVTIIGVDAMALTYTV